MDGVFYWHLWRERAKDLQISNSLLYRLSVAKEGGSDGSTAGGGRSDLSEWPRSVCNAGATMPRCTPGTATVRRILREAPPCLIENKRSQKEDHPLGQFFLLKPICPANWILEQRDLGWDKSENDKCNCNHYNY